jgi:hypothetical protein
MIEETRDPEVQSIRGDWNAPPPSPEFRGRLLHAFDREFARTRWLRRWPLAAAAVGAAGLLIAVLVSHSGAAGFQPVSQPHFIVVSEGEHP